MQRGFQTVVEQKELLSNFIEVKPTALLLRIVGEEFNLVYVAKCFQGHPAFSFGKCQLSELGQSEYFNYLPGCVYVAFSRH